MVPGHVALHVGVAVKGCDPPVDTVGVIGATATEVKVTGVGVTVMIVELSLVTPLSVAFTKMPTVPPVVPALKSTDAPLPEREPSALLERVQE
jgi:hypothetical protein